MRRSHARSELAHVIAAIRRELGIGVLVIEHHVPLVKDVADTISVLNFGSVLTSGPPDRVTNDPAVMEAYLGSRATALTTAAGPA